MTQISRFWNGTTIGDASGVAPYDANEKFAAVLSAIGGIDSDANKGAVVANTLNELACSGTSSPVSIDTGVAFVDGTWYKNDAVVSPNVTKAYGYIVLEKDNAAQTVRVVIEEDNAAYPVLTQTTGAAGVWQYPLASFTLVTGTVAIVDMRTFIGMRTMRLIDSYTVAGALDEITFDVPQGYSHLKLIGSFRSTDASEDSAYLEFNGVSGVAYSRMDVATSRAAAFAGNATVWATEDTGVAGVFIVSYPGTGDLANSWSQVEALISDYASTTKRTRVHSRWSYFISETGGSSELVDRTSIGIGPVGPITSIRVWSMNNYAVGTKLSLYGLP